MEKANRDKFSDLVDDTPERVKILLSLDEWEGFTRKVPAV